MNQAPRKTLPARALGRGSPVRSDGGTGRGHGSEAATAPGRSPSRQTSTSITSIPTVKPDLGVRGCRAAACVGSQSGRMSNVGNGLLPLPSLSEFPRRSGHRLIGAPWAVSGIATTTVAVPICSRPPSTFLEHCAGTTGLDFVRST